MGVEDFLDFMPATVNIAPYVSTTIAGVKTYGSDVPYPCRLEMKNHIVIDKDGREVMAAGRIFLGTTTIPGISDRITLPAGFSRSQPIIISVDPVYDESGVHHIKLEFR